MRSNRRLRVLAVTPTAVPGGAEKWLLTVLDNPDRIALQLIVLADGPLVAEAGRRGIDTVARDFGRSPRELFLATLWLRKRVREFRPDAVLINMEKVGLVTLPYCYLAGVPTVFVKHDTSFDGSLSPLMGRFATRSIAVSPKLATELPQGRTRTIYPPVPVPDSERGVRPARTHRLRLVMLSRLVPSKGIDTAIRALALVDGWELVIAGIEDPSFVGELDRLLELADSLGISDRVSFIGRTEGPDEVLARADAAAMLSRPGARWEEGFGLVLVEAAAVGLPTIADPRHVPAVEAMGSRGVIPVDAEDPDSVAEAIRELSSSDLRRSVGVAAWEAVSELPGDAEVSDLVVDVLADAAVRPGTLRSVGPAFSVVTAVLNEIAEIDKLVSAIERQLRRTSDADPHDEALFVDGGSSDGTWERIQELAVGREWLTALQQPGGVSAQRNAGVRAARNEWIAFVDAGCSIGSGWLEAFRQAAATEDFGLLSGFWDVGYDERPWQQANALATYPDVREARHPDLLTRVHGAFFGLRQRADLPNGRSMAMSKAAWRDAGGWPEDMVTAEDVELGQRIVRSGHQAAMVSGAVVGWEQRSTLAETWRMYYRYGQGDGQTRNPVLVGRSFARAAAYGIGPILVKRGGVGRWAVVAGAALYVSVPVRRAFRARAGARVMAAMPAMMMMKDLGKAAGCFQGLVPSRGGLSGQSSTGESA